MLGVKHLMPFESPYISMQLLNQRTKLANPVVAVGHQQDPVSYRVVIMKWYWNVDIDKVLLTNTNATRILYAQVVTSCCYPFTPHLYSVKVTSKTTVCLLIRLILVSCCDHLPPRIDVERCVRARAHTHAHLLSTSKHARRCPATECGDWPTVQVTIRMRTHQ